MSESISYRRLGEENPAEFFRSVVEPLADSFDPANVGRYVSIMREWGLAPVPAATRVPHRVETVYVLSRVTLGADIKITSIVLDAMKRRFPEARVAFVANRKSAELFELDKRIEWLDAAYPRSGPVSARIAFGHELRQRLGTPGSIVVDPDSRMTQLGLIAVCEPDNYFHFPSRSVGGHEDNLTDLTNGWLRKTFAVEGRAFVAPREVAIDGDHPRAAVSLGVGENDSKRVGDFESGLIRALAAKYRSIWIDRGAGGEEAERVTAAAADSGVAERVRYWEGSFAGFVSAIGQCDFYAGYDSAGQHAAAALGIPLVSIFKGAASQAFRNRWAPVGKGRRLVFDADAASPAEILRRLGL